ncbi:MAG: nucleoside triphosphate pyrophosphohydrolase [Bacilli bacterium]|nr:nucleoside triphosphate pyrophosphohydrolase [Bacilli bacterium]
MEQIFNKLVRDRIPEIIVNNGGQAFTRVLDHEEYKKELEKKMIEEYNEALNSSGKERIEELADLIEIIKCLAEVENSSLDEVIEVSKEKCLKRGSFKNKIFLEKTID